MTDAPAGNAAAALAARLEVDLASLDSELAEIQLLIGQARTEAQRHEQKRVQAAERVSAPGRGSPDDLTDAYATLVTMTRRATLMEAQVDVLEGKYKALARHRAAVADVLERVKDVPPEQIAGSSAVAPKRVGSGGAADDGTQGGISGVLPPSVSRVVLNAQEDLRRDIARAMHDGPAQSLTNIVLQAQIVERLVDKDPAYARGETRLLVSMVQQTLEATKSFIFDVRPMVLDDLGLVPTLRRSTRERGRKAHVHVEFESVGQDRRLAVDVESGVFRILDEALSAYLALSPERVRLRLEWGEALEARLSAQRPAVLPQAAELGDGEPIGDVPNALRQMIQDRADAHQAAIEAAEQAAIIPLPPATRRDALARAASIDATIEFLGGGGEVRVVVPLPFDDDGAAEG